MTTQAVFTVARRLAARLAVPGSELDGEAPALEDVFNGGLMDVFYSGNLGKRP
jgi:hypothetical protein